MHVSAPRAKRIFENIWSKFGVRKRETNDISELNRSAWTFLSISICHAKYSSNYIGLILKISWNSETNVSCMNKSQSRNRVNSCVPNRCLESSTNRFICILTTYLDIKLFCSLLVTDHNATITIYKDTEHPHSIFEWNFMSWQELRFFNKFCVIGFERVNFSHVMRKPVLAICEQQRCRSSAQSEQHLCCSLLR